MPDYKRKRSGPSQVGMNKRKRVAPIGPAMRSGAFYARENPRIFVRRTPGGMITADNHYFDAQLPTTTIAAVTGSWIGTEYDTTGALSLFSPVQGDDITNRQGRKVFLKKLRLRCNISCSPQTANVTADQESLIRVIVYKDTQTNGAQAQGEDVMASGTATVALHMFQNLANLGRFVVMYDKIHKISQRTIDAGLQSGAAIFFKINLKPNCLINYNSGVTGTVTDVVDNSFHLIINTNNSSMVPQLEYKVRGVFTA